jgi:hypothetical protein
MHTPGAEDAPPLSIAVVPLTIQAVKIPIAPEVAGTTYQSPYAPQKMDEQNATSGKTARGVNLHIETSDTVASGRLTRCPRKQYESLAVPFLKHCIP